MAQNGGWRPNSARPVLRPAARPSAGAPVLRPVVRTSGAVPRPDWSVAGPSRWRPQWSQQEDGAPARPPARPTGPSAAGARPTGPSSAGGLGVPKVGAPPTPKTVGAAKPAAGATAAPKASSEATPADVAATPPAAAEAASAADVATPPASAAPAKAAPAKVAGDSTVEMKNFPGNWVSPFVEASLVQKITHLLQKFGELVEAPSIRQTGGTIVATATFLDGTAAQSASKMLHGVDNRTEAEKKKVGHRPPKGTETFHVQVKKEVQPSSTEGPSGAGKCLRLAELPAEWTDSDVQELCSQYGEVDDCVSEAAGCFVVTFREAKAASEASEALYGLELQKENGDFAALQCELLQAVQEEVNGNEEDAQNLEDEHHEDQNHVAADQHGAADKVADVPVIFYVDQLQQAKDPPGKDDCEIFMRDLPYEDYDEPQLKEWLDEFGTVKQVLFVKDPGTEELTGLGYVRFATHAEAEGLLQAFPAEEDNVKGSWSLSERLLKGESGPYKADVVGAILSSLGQLQENLQCSSLDFLSHGPEGGRMPHAQAGPLYFSCSRQHRLGSSEALQKHLAEHVQRVISSLEPRTAPAMRAPKPRGSAALMMPETQASAKEVEKTPAAPAAVDGPSPEDPCIVVRGFPDSWQQAQVKMTFALYGGVKAVKFIQDENGRAAHVYLKNADRMSKVAEELNNKQVGDGELIEECVIACHMRGGSRSTSIPKVLFVDELAMGSRPNVKPGPNDKEVFLQNLPVRECSEEDIFSWLEGFGTVKSVYLLKKPGENGETQLTGKGYVTFATQVQAAACIEAHFFEGDAEDGDICAHWSESERASQQSQSVYGRDVLKAFDQKVLDTVKRASQANSLCLASGTHRPKDPSTPASEATQLHFIVDCTDAQFGELKDSLSRVLEDFHRSLDNKKGPETKPSNRAPAAGPDASRGTDVPPGHWAPQGQAAGYGRPPDWQGGYAGWARGPAPPGGHYGWAPGVAPGYPPGPVGHAWGHAPWLPGQGPPPTSSASGASPPAAEREASSNQAAIQKGEDLIKDAQKHLDSGGSAQKAYNKYCKGLQVLLAILPKLPEDDPAAANLRQRLDIHLEAAERLKQRIESNPKSGSGSTRKSKSQEDPPAPSGGRTSKSAKTDGKAQADTADDDKAAVREKISKGEQLIHDGQTAEDRGVYDKAYEKYCLGLQDILEVLPHLDDEGEGKEMVASLRAKVNSYLERAEKLKEKLDKAGKGGAGAEKSRDKADKRSAAHGSERGDRDGHGRRGASDALPRSRSRQRHKHRSQSRSRRHGKEGRSKDGKDRDGKDRDRDAGHARAARRSRSRSGGGSRKAPLPPPLAPSPKAPGFGGLTGDEEGVGARPKSSAAGVGQSAPRPLPAASGLPPSRKSGASLLVGKAKAVAKSALAAR